MEKMQTPVLAGVGGVAILAAMVSMGGKPSTAPDADRQQSGTQKYASTAAAGSPTAPNYNGPWFAVCREYSTHNFDEGSGQRPSGGYVAEPTPKGVDSAASEYTRRLPSGEEKYAVKQRLIADLGSCVPANSPVKVMIAMVADPDETEMRLQFDRDIDAIQEGAGEQDYFYSGFWFPWRSQSWADSKKDEEIEAEALRRQEPGVLVFRNKKGERLFVFVVGETPTSGVNRVQMALALRYSNILNWVSAGGVGQHPTCMKGTLPISGPQFSASFLSLRDVLSDVAFPEECKDSAGERSVRIISPNATADDFIQHFQEFCGGREPNCAFLPLALSERKTQSAVLEYLTTTLKYDPHRIAHLVENESAFGNTSATACDSDDATKRKRGCGPGKFGLVLTFPRELSSLRSASDKQSEQISQSLANVLPAAPGAGPVKLADDEPGGRDRPTAFSPQEEAGDVSDSLAGVVQLLHSNRVQAVLVSATNPLDRIAILEYLHDQLPDVRVVVSDAEQFEATKPHYVDMAGTLNATGFPALPEVFSINGVKQDNVSFAESGQEGEFLATVLLLDGNLSQSAAGVKAAFSSGATSIGKGLAISIVGEDGFRLLPIGLDGKPLGEDAARAAPVFFTATLQQDVDQDKKDATQKQSVLTLGIDETSPPPRAFYVFTLVVFGITVAHLVLLLLCERKRPDGERPTVWTYPGRSQKSTEWKRLYFLSMLSNQVVLLNLLLFRLEYAAWRAYAEPGAVKYFVAPAAVLTLSCMALPAFFVTRAALKARKDGIKIGFDPDPAAKTNFRSDIHTDAKALIRIRTEKQLFWGGAVSAVAYTLMSLWLVLTWDFGGSQTYLARFLCLADGLSPVLPFASVVFAYGLWAFLQLRRVGWVISRRADVELGVTPDAKLHRAMENLLPNIKSQGGGDGFSFPAMLGLVLACVFLNLRAGTHSFETPLFHYWFLVWGVPMLLVTVIFTFFQAFSIWRDLIKLLSFLELTPIKEEFEKLGKDGLIDVKIWDLAKPQRLFVLHKLTLETMEKIFKSTDPEKVEEARKAVNKIIDADEEGRQASDEDSDKLDTTLNAGMEMAYHALDLSNRMPWGQAETLRRYMALRLITLIRYALLQVRNLLYFIVYGYMLAAVSVMFYPFQGGKSLGELLSLVFVVLLFGVGAIMFGIQRNRVLGRIENGSSEGAGYLQIAVHLLTVGGLPALALLASQFPAVAQFALSFLRPVLGVLH
jgi:hypothetical protein